MLIDTHQYSRPHSIVKFFVIVHILDDLGKYGTAQHPLHDR